MSRGPGGPWRHDREPNIPAGAGPRPRHRRRPRRPGLGQPRRPHHRPRQTTTGSRHLRLATAPRTGRHRIPAARREMAVRPSRCRSRRRRRTARAGRGRRHRRHRQTRRRPGRGRHRPRPAAHHLRTGAGLGGRRPESAAWPAHRQPHRRPRRLRRHGLPALGPQTRRDLPRPDRGVRTPPGAAAAAPRRPDLNRPVVPAVPAAVRRAPRSRRECCKPGPPTAEPPARRSC